ncbi:monofunctional biosynthetic peptidoglycan transglycosylase [Bradyrhizobium sp. LHD-71]|uniref:monofunctional biosynthetic peptidoglycan transglycosylase n=1 Tax=Bradyrhizobium sp. LHD-71 TaxID=3072141 RepID=UPI00280EFE5B|nr:monofunctional biosynthetic peptidoglycan transglycosylase [Bradyrhizobium sp. LHD-71]MDQ8730913.1 monofunctional biosynthetic peptidoglycan transglycosylase [Bradyrhizobium sp. LHD-71]
MAHRFRRLARTLFLAVFVLLAMPYVLVPVYRTGHPVSTLMLARWFTGQNVTREWLDYAEIAPVLPLTVIAAEDARFCAHRGIDWDALQDAIDEMQDGEAGRGASTISQQTAKNLFLWPGRSFVRKALEFPLAIWIDFVLPKRRVLEIYLNIAEWGPNGQFGAEAGAQHAFGRSARNLSPQQAALMVAILPNPVTRSAGKPRPGLRNIAARYVARARGAPEIADCLRQASGTAASAR